MSSISTMETSWTFCELDASHAHFKDEIDHHFVTNGLTCNEPVCALLYISDTI